MIALNLLGPYPFGYFPSFYDLLMLGIGSFIVISFLLMYYDMIPKSNASIDKLDIPIYQSTDVLLQSKSDDVNFEIAKKSSSTFVKVVVFILVLYILFNPFNQHLNFAYFY